MRLKQTSLFLLATFFCHQISAETGPFDQLIMQENTCQEKAVSTIDMRNCVNQARKNWEEASNKIYKKLENSLSNSEMKALLGDSQNAWTAYQEKEIAFLKDYYSAQDGTIWPLVHDQVVLKLIQQRAYYLNEILNSLDLQ